MSLQSISDSEHQFQRRIFPLTLSFPGDISSAKLPYSNDPVLFVGTSEGLLQMRNAKTGICHYEENFGASISGIFVIEPTMEPSKADQDIFIVVLLSSGVLHVLKPIDTAVIDRNNLESLTKRKQVGCHFFLFIPRDFLCLTCSILDPPKSTRSTPVSDDQVYRCY